MTNLDELLRKYNPNGVSPVKLGDVLDYEQPSKYIVSSSEYDDNYDIPVLTAGQSFILGYTDETDGVYKASKKNPTIIFDDFTTGYHWVDFDFKVKSSAMKMLRLRDNNSLLRYVFHSMALINYVPSEHSRQWISKYSQFEIPIPHIKVQEEIVEILDSFTNLIDTLNEELSLRQKQFEYYREKLLTFDNEEPVKMNDIILNLRTGLNPRTHFKLNTEDADCFYITVRELGLFDIVVDDKTDKINSQAIGRINERSNIQQNDILFSGTGTIGRTALVKNEIYKWNVKEGVYVITPNIMKVNPRYFIYLLHSNYLQIQYEVKAEGGAVKSVSMKEFKSLLVHIPTLAIQQSIVEKLDAFESLISSIKEEIALRQKQYEYYREKLLTFN